MCFTYNHMVIGARPRRGCRACAVRKGAGGRGCGFEPWASQSQTSRTAFLAATPLWGQPGPLVTAPLVGLPSYIFACFHPAYQAWTGFCLWAPFCHPSGSPRSLPATGQCWVHLTAPPFFLVWRFMFPEKGPRGEPLCLLLRPDSATTCVWHSLTIYTYGLLQKQLGASGL